MDKMFLKHSCKPQDLKHALPRLRHHNRTPAAVQQYVKKTKKDNDVGGEIRVGIFNTDIITCCRNMSIFLSSACAENNGNNDGEGQVAVSSKHIYGYMRFLFRILSLDLECCVYANIYVRRLLSNGQANIIVHPGNWHRILVGACLLASKYTNDHSIGNIGFSKVLKGCPVEFMHKLESKYLHVLNWKLYVPISEYVSSYFDLVTKGKDYVRDWEVDFKTIDPYFNLNV